MPYAQGLEQQGCTKILLYGLACGQDAEGSVSVAMAPYSAL